MKTILLVEDDPTLSDLYEEFLSAEGFKIVKARDLEQGLNSALQKDISFILMDVMLAAHTSGLDLLKTLKEDDKAKNIPVVVLTNVAKDKERNLAFKLGAKEYLVKAAQKPKDVVEVVKKYIT